MAEVKGQLQRLIDEIVNSIDVAATDQKLKLLQPSLHYALPKQCRIETTERPYKLMCTICGLVPNKC